MPEGDSIHRLASRLRPVLTGRVVEDFTAHRIPDATARTLIGHRVVAVEARGKNLLVRFDDGRALLVHLRMEGRVFVERPRSAFWTGLARSSPDMRLDVGTAAVVGRRLPVCQLLTEGQQRRIPALARLGPDLLGDDFDERDLRRRFEEKVRASPERPIADVLLDQTIAAGIGNVYKSEILFLEGVHPDTSAASLDEETFARLYRTARELLLRNVGGAGHGRTTRPTLGKSRSWVYGRGGRACFRCEGTIVRVMSGADAGRSTYVCERCQPRRGERT